MSLFDPLSKSAGKSREGGKFSLLDALFDTPGRRSKTADGIRIELSKAQAGDEEALSNIVRSAGSGYRFEECYALDALSELQSPVKSALLIQIAKLGSIDPFVRHAAGCALWVESEKHGKVGFAEVQQELIAALVELIQDHSNEGAAEFGIKILTVLEAQSEEISKALTTFAAKRGSSHC